MNDQPPANPDRPREYVGLSVRDALYQAARVLADSGSDSPRLDAEVLLAHVLGTSRTDLYVRWAEPLAEEPAQRFAALVRRRAAHEPVAYLIGHREFYDLDLYVDRRVLIPRPETEHMLEEALAWARGAAGNRAILARGTLRVVDVGTGSGALAVALARHLENAHVWAVDLSAEALEVAEINVRRYNLQDRVTLVQGDLLAPLAGPLDIITANLPYVPQEDLSSLAPDVAAYEPRSALDGGKGGLDVILRLLEQAPERLAYPGLLLLEIDHRQMDTVLNVARIRLPDARASVVRDYAGLARVICIERPAMI
ncbi:MAG: peptide chain release factor N(5)-glutamine methyltransferase [Chloroflexi bacterium]|jgi:release factor glutamine methyltransferase|nr:peptide chain release factor N(5)-glutamine methyltransferase [Chloroflexota bacterium]